MLCGKAYARVIRWYSLLRLALASISLKEPQLTDEENTLINDFYLNENATNAPFTVIKLNFLHQTFND